MVFDSPWFALLLPLPLLLRFLTPAVKPKPEEGPELFFPALQRLKSAFPVHAFSGAGSSLLPLLLLSLSWIFLILALMQPEKVDRFTQVKNEGYDLLLAVDVSASMQALDFSTASKTISRLDITKEVVGKFVRAREGDRVGLLAFGESAYLHVPLTLDTLSVSKMLDDIAPGMAGNATAIGDAVGLAVRTLRERPKGSRVLILLTDGEDNASRIAPLEAAKLAKQYGIKVYTIGIGKKGTVPFPTPFGYQMVSVSLDEDLLKEIAVITDGQYFSATDKSGLESIYAQINALEKTEANATVFFIREPLYRYPLSLCALLLLVCALWRPGRRLAYGS